jgi:hypothetical protein
MLEPPDIFFSQNDGLAETRHVFLDGHNLPQAWAGRQEFTISELGFGTGLNLPALSLLSPPGLLYQSVEWSPVPRELILRLAGTVKRALRLPFSPICRNLYRKA